MSPEPVARLATTQVLAPGETTADLPSPNVRPSPVTPIEAAESEDHPGLDSSFRLLAVEECARLAASLARRPDETERLLAAGAVSLAVWKANEAYWAQVLREEAAKGRAKLLCAYDTAFVTRLELERGAISVEDYARLVVAAERGQTANALQALDLPQGSVARIERVLLRRVVDHPALVDEVRRAVERLRGG
jgi:hypothetical protein